MRWWLVLLWLVYLLPAMLLSVLLLMTAARELSYLGGEWLTWSPGEISRRWLSQFAAGTVSVVLILAVGLLVVLSRNRAAVLLATIDAVILAIYIY
ncbi:hypothetical protein [Aureliella helgolandensis]|uniref:hypothetical protein n=1 Tax=Aureliella helgolandensis TaxID=2527968 RepID=UPI00119DA75D|nr:hypothetical protein [Aureliella helgolandensis]